MCWGAHASRRAGFGVAPKRTFLFSRRRRLNGCQENFAIARTLSPGRRGDRSPEFGCDVVEVVLSFALSLGDVTRF